MTGDLSPTRTLRLTIAYDGTAYAGWQVQPGKPTVQETLENAVAKVTGRRVRVLASGRTDAGVHALGQVVGLRTDSALPPEVLCRALNANLPHDVAVLDVAEAPAGFHATHDALRKRYRYVIYDGPVRDVFKRHFVWHYAYGRLDAESMHRAAVPLLGTHDFSSFQSSGAERKSGVRTIFDIVVERGRAGQGGKEGFGIGDSRFGIRDSGFEIRDSGLAIGDRGLENAPRLRSRGACSPDSADFITIEVEANGFLYNMVRSIVGTLVEVGRGRGRRVGPARSFARPTAASPGPPRRRRDFSW